MKNQIDDEQTGLASGIKNYTDGVKKIQTGLDGDGTLANPGLVNGIKAYTNGVSTLNLSLIHIFSFGSALGSSFLLHPVTHTANRSPSKITFFIS